MDIRKPWLVARREYLENLRTKTFWIGILALPVILVLAAVVPIWLEGKKDVRRYAVLDRSGWLAAAVEERASGSDLAKVIRWAIESIRENAEALEKLPVSVREQVAELENFEEERVQTLADDEPLREWWESLPPDGAKELALELSRERYQRVDIEIDAAAESPESELNRRLNGGELFAYFVIGPDPVESGEGCKYVSNNRTDDSLRRWYSDLASDEVRSRRLAEKGIDEGLASWIEKPLMFESRKVTAAGEEAEVRAEDTLSQFGPVAFVYILFISIFTIAQMLLTNTIEEKSSRIIEVLLSSVSPHQLMAGKIAGLAATGLTVIASWVAFFLVFIKLLPRFVERMPDIDFSVLLSDPAYIASFVLYFLLGYLLYAAFFVGIGSVCNTLKEAQNLILPVVLVLIVPLLAMVPIGQDPNGALARFLSYIPPFTPFVMMNRAAGPPSELEYVVTTALLVASIAAALWGAGKVFSVGILMTGKPPRPLEILRMIASRTRASGVE